MLVIASLVAGLSGAAEAAGTRIRSHVQRLRRLPDAECRDANVPDVPPQPARGSVSAVQG
jgi:hypothetical protein